MRKKPWLYSAPALLLILIVVVFPIGYTAYISLTNMNLYHWADFRVIGLSNYVRALFKFDSGFLGGAVYHIALDGGEYGPAAVLRVLDRPGAERQGSAPAPAV